MKPHVTYRVVGVRSDASRMVICEKVTKEQAERVKQSLDNGNVFRSIEVELEDESDPELDLFTDQ